MSKKKIRLFLKKIFRTYKGRKKKFRKEEKFSEISNIPKFRENFSQTKLFIFNFFFEVTQKFKNNKRNSNELNFPSIKKNRTQQKKIWVSPKIIHSYKLSKE